MYKYLCSACGSPTYSEDPDLENDVCRFCGSPMLHKVYELKSNFPNADFWGEERETTIKPNAGKQSPIHFSARDYIARALPRMGTVEYDGAMKYGRDNWQLISREDNIEHAMLHLANALTGVDTGEDELAHAACRIAMAIAREEE
ncbi:MAG: dATP/dGTP diphosphohydrolase domain-containing protein [Clostridiaceae bacterium]|nr:dATP/dGTP diphosphohydrolase domain-containing protein [Clostridiaceae bacterium]